MHFSLITPAQGHEREAAQEWTRGAYEEHQWLWRFQPAPAGSPRTFLFRRRDVDGLPRFYMVSRQPPMAASAHWLVQSKPYAPELAAGEWLAFELRANPVVTVRGASGRPARHDVVMQAKTKLLAGRGLARWSDWTTPDRPALPDLVQSTCGAWLNARAARLGMALDDASLRVEGYEQHRGKGGELRISTVDFGGRLQVVDPVALRRALYEGVGHAKAFGCGLLLVRRLG
jgi:CRISPR system Cascade subunit CasE